MNEKIRKAIKRITLAAAAAAAFVFVVSVPADAEPRVPYKNPYYDNEEYQDYLESLNGLWSDIAKALVTDNGAQKKHVDYRDRHSGFRYNLDKHGSEFSGDVSSEVITNCIDLHTEYYVLNDFVFDDAIELKKGESADIGKYLQDHLASDKRKVEFVSAEPLEVYTDGTTEPIKVSGSTVTAVTPLKTAVVVTVKETRALDKIKKRDLNVAYSDTFGIVRTGVNHGERYKVTEKTRKEYKRKYLIRVYSCTESDPHYEPWGIGDQRAVWANGWEKRMSKKPYSQLAYIELLMRGNDDDFCMVNEPGLKDCQIAARHYMRNGHIMDKVYNTHFNLFYGMYSEYLCHQLNYEDFLECEAAADAGSGTEIDRLARICDMISQLMEYNYSLEGSMFSDPADYLSGGSYEARAEADVIYGICGNYATITEKILNFCGIPCVPIRSSSGFHEFVRVYINGAVFGIDTTWDDECRQYKDKNTKDGNVKWENDRNTGKNRSFELTVYCLGAAGGEFHSDDSVNSNSINDSGIYTIYRPEWAFRDSSVTSYYSIPDEIRKQPGYYETNRTKTFGDQFGYKPDYKKYPCPVRKRNLPA